MVSVRFFLFCLIVRAIQYVRVTVASESTESSGISMSQVAKKEGSGDRVIVSIVNEGEKRDEIV
jgi:hypothetical protein